MTRQHKKAASKRKPHSSSNETERKEPKGQVNNEKWEAYFTKRKFMALIGTTKILSPFLGKQSSPNSKSKVLACYFRNDDVK